MGVGAAFDFVSHAKRRAPMWMQRNGLEWAHRLALEPRRLSGRYVRSGTELAVSLVRDSVRCRMRRERSARTHGGPV
jgi:N-acetylglucosaminyldiphosphoundecaprenol N-acetyl-beta-D-mannosaminyltransferase